MVINLKRQSIVLKSAVAILTIVLIGKLVNVEQFSSLAKAVPAWVFLVSVVLMIMRTILSAQRWRVLSPQLSSIGLWPFVRLMFMTSAINLFLPSTIAVDVIRSVVISKETNSGGATALLSVYIDRLVGLCTLIGLGILAMFFIGEVEGKGQFTLILLIAALVVLCCCWVGSNQRLNSIVQVKLVPFLERGSKIAAYCSNFLTVISGFRISRPQVALAVVLSIVIHGSWFLLVWLLAVVINAPVTFAGIVFATIFTWLITMLPISFAGIGIRELSFVYFLSLVGVTAEQGLLLGAFQSLMILIGCSIGLPMLWRYRGGTKV